jgi:hypothetical protein
LTTSATSSAGSAGWRRSAIGPAGPGLGLTIDEAKVATHRRLFGKCGQYLPYQDHDLAHEERA